MNTAVMQPTGNEVSAEAFRDHRRSGKANTGSVLVMIALRNGVVAGVESMTRNELADRTGLPLSSVCGRCCELLHMRVLTVADTTKEKPTRQLLSLTEIGRYMAEGYVIKAEEAS